MDLRIQPPRRPSNTSVAGIVGVARMTDKARAHENGTLGDYFFGNDSGQDKALLEFLGISAEEFEGSALEMEDETLASWVRDQSGRSEKEIDEFNQEYLNREPESEKMKAILRERVEKFGDGREVRTGFQSQELDDWGSFREKDLTAAPPRSAYDRAVAGIVGLARMAEKARARRSGKLGEYQYGRDSGLDQNVFEWLELSQESFEEAAYLNPNDIELGAWVLRKTKKTGEEIAAFNRKAVMFAPETEEEWAYLKETVKKLDPSQPDVGGWFKLMDLDDEKSFGMIDLRRHPPRSGYETEVAGIAGLARTIDKGRAYYTGTLGDYWYGEDSGMDRNLLEFLGVTPQEFSETLRACPTDADVAAWVRDQCPNSPKEIVTYNDETVGLGPRTDPQWEFLKRAIEKLDPGETKTIRTWLELMDLDDRISFDRSWSGN